MGTGPAPRGVWVFLALFFAGSLLLFSYLAPRTALRGEGVLLGGGLLLYLLVRAAAGTWLVGSALVLSFRRPLRRGYWRTSAWYHGVTVLVGAWLVLLSEEIHDGFALAQLPPERLLLSFPWRLTLTLGGQTATYALLLVPAAAWVYQRRRREIEAAELPLQAHLAEAELARTQAELRALKLELNPHFLFNALGALNMLIHLDADEAARVLARLRELVRRAIASAWVQEVELERELEFLRLYLEVEQVRFGERLQVEWDVPVSTRAARVPHLILQPLVENAIKHGIARSARGGRVRISALADGGRLRLSVHDSGAGGGARPAAAGTGVGLANIRERLARLYGAEPEFELNPDPAGGTRAVLGLPLRLSVN